MIEKLIQYGFDRYFIENLDYQTLEQHEIARITAVFKDKYIITCGETEIPGELTGKLMYNATSPIDFPAVGDWVLVNCYDENSHALIHEVLPRMSLLKRKTSGKKVDFQLIAANIDTGLIIQSLNENFNLRRLERYLVMCYESGITPVVVLSKRDLVRPEEVESRISETRTLQQDLEIIPISCETGDGFEGIERILEPCRTYCMLGSSGVGKTTLLNRLLGKSLFATNTTSTKESKGRHTTTHRQLIKLAGGSMIVDTPGMRELGNFAIDSGLDETFSDIRRLIDNCYFSDCTHTNERGCAVRDALENGELSAERFQNYMKMSRESRYNEMSYLEKRNKDKQFGKMCKDVMRQKKHKRY